MMQSRRGGRSIVAWAPIALAAASCATPRSEVVLVPAGSDTYFYCSSEVVEVRSTDRVESSYPVPPGAGRPVTSAIDLELGGLVAVAYEHQLAVAAGGGEPHWIDQARFPVRSLSLRSERWLVLGDRKLCIGALRGDRRWVGPAGLDLERVVYAVPLSDTGFLVAGQRGDEVWLQHLEGDQGALRSLRSSRVRGLNELQIGCSAGGAMFLAGVLESVPMTAGRQHRAMVQKLVVVRVDPDTLVADEVVFRESHDLSTVVTGIAVGTRFVALVLNGETLRVFDMEEDGRRASLDFEQHFDYPISIAWHSPVEVAVIGAGRPLQFFDVRS